MHNQNPNWGPGPDPTAHYNANFQGAAGGKKSYNNNNNNNNKYPQNNMSMGQPQHPSSIITSGPQGGGGPGYGNNNYASQGMYDIERRPPKSAELFDPTGGSGSSSSSNGTGFGYGPGPGDFGYSRQYSNDGGGYGSGQDGSLISPNDRNSNNSHQGYQNQSGNFNQHPQSTQPPPNNLSQFPPLQSHTPVAMTRSYSSTSSTGGGGGYGPHQGKKNNTSYDYSVMAAPSNDGSAKSPSGKHHVV